MAHVKLWKRLAAAIGKFSNPKPGRAKSMFGRKRKQDDFNAEVEAHIALEADRLKEQGLSEEEALMAARRAFGNLTQAQERFYESGRWVWWDQLLQDLRYGLRQLRRNPGFTAVAVVTLALGIAINTTIFSAVSLVLLKKPAFPDPGRLMMVYSNNKAKGYNYFLVSASDFVAFQRQNDVFAIMAADTNHGFTLTGDGPPEHLWGAEVTPNFFRVLGLSPALGRSFLPSEGNSGRNNVAILSHGLWKEHYASNPDVVGSTIEIDDHPHTVIGVMPPGTGTPLQQAQLWTPIVFSAKDLSDASRRNRYLYVFARLKPGMKPRRAGAEIAAIATRIARRHPETEKGYGASALTLQNYLIRAPQVEASLTILMGAVGFVLLIACANIAGLLLARSSGRQHEMAVRAALGAGRLRVIRQLLTESLLIALIGGGLGTILGFWGIRFLRTAITWNSYVLYLSRNLRLDSSTLWFTIAITVGATLLFGLAPALRASRSDLVAALKEGGRSRIEGFARNRLRSTFVAGEVALSVVLLVGAGLFIEGFLADLTQNPGFNAKHVITALASLPNRRYGNSQSKQLAFFERVTEKLCDLPGARSASVTSALPMSGGCLEKVKIEGRSGSAAACSYAVGSRYFRTMEIPLIKGREFSPLDNVRSTDVAIVNQAFAEKYFPKGNAIGSRILVKTTRSAWAEVVGIVGNVKDWPGQPIWDPQVYEPYAQHPLLAMTFVARTGYAAATLAPLLRRTVWSVDKDEPVERVMTMREVEVEAGVGGDRLMSGLMSAFGALALILSAVGIYGVIAYSVSRRTHEIGIRMALGAQKKDVLSLVLRQGGLLMVVGCTIGLTLALPLPKLFVAMFNGMTTGAPQVLGAVPMIVCGASMIATYIPARRAAKVDPMVALRYE